MYYYMEWCLWSTTSRLSISKNPSCGVERLPVALYLADPLKRIAAHPLGAYVSLVCFVFMRLEALFQYGGKRSQSYYRADACTPTPSVSLCRSLVHSASSAPRRLNSDTQPCSFHQMRMPSGEGCPTRLLWYWWSDLILTLVPLFHQSTADVDDLSICS